LARRGPCQISAPLMQRQGCRTPKTEILLRFDKNVEYKRPAKTYPLSDVHKICRVCTPFQDALANKIWLDLLEGLGSYGGFKLRGSGYRQIFRAPTSGETMRQTPKVLEMQERARGPLSPCQVWVAKNVEFFCLSVCLFVTLLNVRDCPPDFAKKALE